MPERNIEIEIGTDGTVSAKIIGIKGQKCREMAKRLAEILGTEISFTPTAEFYEEDVQTQLDIEEDQRQH